MTITHHLDDATLMTLKDRFAPPSVQRRMQELIPDSEIRWFDEGGHMLPVEESDAIAAAMVEFVDRRVAAPSVPPSMTPR